eukprot:TRINITY_DN70633_c0_g1_i1.p1 TRINITY_DN70633_c0_g1~~TRINITY_DN70633_c0_g1_i1.p1  ORF type:complete len:1411 (+),score=359.25 TRINITY_DN70633_c0_g1_i1:82-4314(+)
MTTSSSATAAVRTATAVAAPSAAWCYQKIGSLTGRHCHRRGFAGGPSRGSGGRGGFRDAGEDGFGGGGGGFMVPRSQQRQRAEPRRVAVAGPAEVLRMSPSDLSAAVRVASQGRNVADLRMWRQYAEAVLFHAGALSPKQLAFIVNAFSRAQVPDRDTFRRLSDRAMEQVEAFEPRDTALFLNAYAKLAFKDLTLFECFSKSLCSNPAGDDGFGEQQLALVANAYARLELADTRLFQVLSGWIVPKVDALTPLGVATIANSYGKVVVRDVALFRAISSVLDRHIEAFEPQQVANVLHAYARLRLNDNMDILSRLADCIPKQSNDYRPVEAAMAASAVTTLGLDHRRALKALADIVRARGQEFRARQLATTLHAFSTLNVGQGALFVDAVPHVLSCARDADSQGLSMLFCAYARAGQPESKVLGALLERLEPLAATLDGQALVNLFMACGRLGLHKETFTRQLARLLHPQVPTLPPLHVANLLFALSRLSLQAEEFGRLLAALQGRVARGELQLEAQQSSNALFALAAIHGAGSSLAAEATVAPPSPSPAVAALVKRVLRAEFEVEWSRTPHLLASCCSSAARLGEAPVDLFALASRLVRSSERRHRKGDDAVQSGSTLSSNGVAELLAAFSAAELVDPELYSWAMLRLTSPGQSGAVTPMSALLLAVDALDYASHILMTGPSQEPFSKNAPAAGSTPFPFDSSQVAGEAGSDGVPGMLFLDCPLDFQKQVFQFYEFVGLELMARSREVSSRELERVAVPFARARLLSVLLPFDLLGEGSMQRFQAIAAERRMRSPLERSRATSTPPIGEETSLTVDGWSGLSGGDDAPETVADEATVLEQLLVELDEAFSSPGAATSTTSATDLAFQLGRYSALLQTPKARSGSALGPQAARTRAIPAAVLDPIVRRLGEQFAGLARTATLPFQDVAAAAEALSGAGVRPKAAISALAAAAEASFPERPCHLSNFEQVASDVNSVAKLLQGLGPCDAVAAGALQKALEEYVFGLATLMGKLESQEAAPLLGERPYNVVTVFLAALAGPPGDVFESRPEILQQPSSGDVSAVTLLLLRQATRCLLLEELRKLLASSDRQEEPDSQADEKKKAREEVVVSDLAALLLEMLRLSGSSSTLPSAGDEVRQVAHALTASTALLLADRLEAAGLPHRQLQLAVLQGLAATPQVAAGATSILGNSDSAGVYVLLLETLLGGLAGQATSSELAGLASCLGACAQLRLPVALERPWFDGLTRQELLLRVEQQAFEAACRLRESAEEDARPSSTTDGELLKGAASVGSELPKYSLAVLRALMVRARSLLPSEAVQAARFCALALDARSLSEEERGEVSQALAKLLEHICAPQQRKRLSLEDRSVLSAIATLLRSEFPELLQSEREAWVPRNVVVAMEEFRGARDSSSFRL